MTANLLSLQSLEEGLGNRIVLTVSMPTDSPFQAIFPQETLTVVPDVLAALVRMHHPLCFGVSPPYRHQHPIQTQFLEAPEFHGPANHMLEQQHWMGHFDVVVADSLLEL